MVTSRIRLERSPRFVTLELIEGRPLLFGTWRLLGDESNVSFRICDGYWEKWPHGNPGGSGTLRLYDATKELVAHLTDLNGRIHGTGQFTSAIVGADFGSVEFDWTLLPLPLHVSKPIAERALRFS